MALLGGLLLIMGVALFALPGPAVVVIPAALAGLALEFGWARRGQAQFRDCINVWDKRKTN